MPATAGRGGRCSSAARSQWAATYSATRIRGSAPSSASSTSYRMNHSLGLRICITCLAASALARETAAEVFIDVGVNGSEIKADIAALPETVTSNSSGLHLGVGLRRDLKQGSIG